tara:strand:- start:38 stop:322 length:285 start_codon:yes stop_codon:yes gene_type:complete
MAQFTITIADADVNRVITALCKNYGYQSDIPNPDFDPSETIHTSPATIPNPESSAQFANRMTRDFLMDHTVAYELQLEKQNVPQPTPPDITDPA